MRLQRLLLCFGVLISGIVFTVQAQDEPLSDPTIEAAVNALLAQTQTAAEQQATGIAATQTVQAALETAIAATAQANITPTPTPEPFNAADLEVASVTETDLRAGLGRTSVYLAPDGVHLAHLNGDEFCLYAEGVQQHCIELDTEMRRLYTETVAWSKDSRYVAFHEDFFRLLIDPDIYVWDTVENTITNLTPEAEEPGSFFASDWMTIDVLPSWLPDGRLLFLRYSRVDGETLQPAIYVTNPDGSGLEQLGSLTAVEPLAIYVIDASANQLVYNYFPQGSSPFTGVWASDLNGENGRKLAGITRDERILIIGITLSADERYALLATVDNTYGVEAMPGNSAYRVLDMETGEISLIDPERFVWGAGWSPRGAALVYTTYNPENADDSGLYIANAPGEPGRQLLKGEFYASTSDRQQGIDWGANNVVVVASRENDFNATLVQLE